MNEAFQKCNKYAMEKKQYSRLFCFKRVLYIYNNFENETYCLLQWLQHYCDVNNENIGTAYAWLKFFFIDFEISQRL